MTQPVRCTPLWPASWLPTLDKSGNSKSIEVQRVWEVYDDRLRFVTHAHDARLIRSLLGGDVSSAWAVGSSAAESALADGPVPNRGLVLGRGAWFRVAQGGPKVRKVQGHA